jgi:hypothetical protein
MYRLAVPLALTLFVNILTFGVKIAGTKHPRLIFLSPLGERSGEGV